MDRPDAYLEEVTSKDLAGVVTEEGAPSGRRWTRPLDHVLLDGRLGDVMAEVLELGLDARRSPEAVLAGESAEHLADLDRDRWPSGLAARSPSPDETPALTVPGNDRGRADDVKAITPPGPQPAEHNPEQAAGLAEPRALHGALDDGDLLAEGEVLQGKRGP